MSIIRPAMDKNSPNWCEGCQKEHGELYICESYSEEKKAKKMKNSETLQKCLQDPAWIKKQIDNGVPPEVIRIFQIFSGVEEE